MTERKLDISTLKTINMFGKEKDILSISFDYRMCLPNIHKHIYAGLDVSSKGRSCIPHRYIPHTVLGSRHKFVACKWNLGKHIQANEYF
jgi:hypothetical protein